MESHGVWGRSAACTAGSHLVDIIVSFRRPPVSTTMPSTRLAAWTRHLGKVTAEVLCLIHDRDVWRTISEIGAANPTVVANPFVMGHFNTLYYRRALVSVRAMVDPNPDSDSLLTLLTGIA